MYQKIATFAFVFAIVALVVGLSGCEKAAQMMPDAKTEMPEMMEGTIPIGIAVALTGEYAEPYGLPMKRGLDLAREEINMHGHENIMTHDHGNIMFVEVDAQSTAEGGVAAVQQLVDQGVPAIVGIGISGHLEQAFPIAQKNGVVAFSPISSKAGLSGIVGDYVFRAGLATNVIMPGTVMATHEKLGYTKVATIYDASDPYSTSSNEEVVKALEAAGVEILAQETVQKGDTDFSTQLTNIMKLAPDALFVSALATQTPSILMQGRELGIPDSTHVIVAELSAAEIQKAGAAADGVITALGWTSMVDTPGNQAFVQNYQAKYGMEPEPWAAQAYASLYILANAIANAQSTDPAAIRDALAQTKDFPTVLGNFSFDPNGEAVYDMIVLMVKDGELQAFEAAAPKMMDTGIPIGVVVPLTGGNAGPYGMAMQNGFELAREEINMTLPPSMHLTFKTEDSQTTIDGSMAAVQTLVDQGVPAIIGFASSAELRESYPIAHESGVVVFSSLSAEAGLSALGDFLFRTGPATDRLIPAGVMATQEKLGYKKAALIYDDDGAYSTSSYEQAKAALETNGVEIVGIETFQKGDTDFSAQLTNIMKLEIDALFISGFAAEITEVIIQGRKLGIPDTVHFIVPDLSISEVQTAGAAAEGAITFISWDGMSNTPGNQAFVQHYQAEYGMAPDAWAAQSYATLYILAEAMKNAQSTDPAAIRDALAQTMNLPTILGDFSFDPNGESVYDPIVLIVKDGMLQSFE